jgi:hypothetical protein
MGTDEERITWWGLFYLTGLEITDTQPGIERPMFCDGTLIALHHIRPMLFHFGVDVENLEETFSRWWQPKAVPNLSVFSNFADQQVKPNCALLVRRTGYASDIPIQQLSGRAREIVSLLTLISLAESQHGNAIALTEDIWYRAKKANQFRASGRSHSIARRARSTWRYAHRTVSARGRFRVERWECRDVA